MKLVFKWEGGYSEAAGDPGGPTNYGITIATLGLYRKLRVTPADVKALTRLEATSIYERYFWDAISADQLQNGVDVIAFDIAVNMGPRRASRWILETDALEPIPRINELHKRRLSFWQHLASFAVVRADAGDQRVELLLAGLQHLRRKRDVDHSVQAVLRHAVHGARHRRLHDFPGQELRQRGPLARRQHV